MLELSPSPPLSEAERPLFPRLDAVDGVPSTLGGVARKVLVPWTCPYSIVELGCVVLSTPEADRVEISCWRRFSIPARRPSIWSIFRSLCKKENAASQQASEQVPVIRTVHTTDWRSELSGASLWASAPHPWSYMNVWRSGSWSRGSPYHSVSVKKERENWPVSPLSLRRTHARAPAAS